jgi:hypothetical protein
MADREMLIREYYAQKKEKIIDCPFQPGNLKISEKACLKRYNAAQRRRFETFKSEDLFNYFVSQSLIRCENCTIIQKSVSRISPPPFATSVEERGAHQAKRGLSR